MRPSPIFLAIVALTAVGGVLAWISADTNRPLAYVGVFTFVIAGWLVSLCLHEFAHAFTAWRFGDHDVAMRGYLTLNPLKYSHPLLSIGLPVLFIAIGRHRPARRRGVCADVVDDAVAADDLVSSRRAVHQLALAVLLLVLTAVFARLQPSRCSGPGWRSSASCR